MPDHEKGPCGLGDRCLRPEFEIRAMYKCCFCGFQLHNPMSGCSRPHGGDDDKVKCIDVIKCIERNSDVLLDPKHPTLLIRRAVGTRPEERKDHSLQTRWNRVKSGAIQDVL